MAAIDPPVLEPDPVTSWVTLRLEELGVTPGLASLAADRRLDWHQVAALVAAGCAPDTAVEILL
jgi:hypothetical protein